MYLLFLACSQRDLQHGFLNYACSVASALLQFDGETYAFGWLVLQVMQGHLFYCGEKEGRRWMAS
ncbi:hypothetical protein RchiOBHm_Chr2g0171871 [Rosa chinensis]|uniref:Uncharacterized protein n=1 Tax=Rosa chinensis TaxID=74649 RepID=A0A2P6S5G1_ROSCH|nr:hypothetical protein RchiOBHm_Chr2g0171871 [Rosa chinensis]